MLFFLLVLALYAVSVALAVGLGLVMSGSIILGDMLRSVWRLAVPSGYLLLLVAFGMLAWELKDAELSLYHAIAYTLGGIGAVTTIANWAERFFAKPLTQDQFDRGIADLKEAIAVQTKTTSANHAELINVVSSLSDDIRAMASSRPVKADATDSSDDAGGR